MPMGTSSAAETAAAAMPRGPAGAAPRPGKLDLGIAAYRDAFGQTPIFDAVKRAESQLLLSQLSKSSIGCEGEQEFVALLGAEAFGTQRRIGGLQTVGGTGALRLAGELLARSASGRRLWFSTPAWEHYLPIFAACGLQVAGCSSHKLLDALQAAAPGDTVLIQACGHNPSGYDGGAEYWDALVEVILERNLTVLADVAYQGLAMGWSEDCAMLRKLIERIPTLLIAYSCGKNFGLYRERAGALFVTCRKAAEMHELLGQLVVLARTSYSMPPHHGAAVVRCILESPRLKQIWRLELEAMRARVERQRGVLSAYGRVGAVDLAQLARGSGMFALLPLDADAIGRLRSEFGVYLGPEGRINIAAFPDNSIDRFVDALARVQQRSLV
jgi:aromatic-amino-acid transaminase